MQKAVSGKKAGSYIFATSLALAFLSSLLFFPGWATAHHSDSAHGDGRIPGMADFTRAGKTTYRFRSAKEDYEIRRPGRPPSFMHAHADTVSSTETGSGAWAWSEEEKEEGQPENTLPWKGHELAPVCRTSGHRIVSVYTHRPGDETPTPTEYIRQAVRWMNWKIADGSSQTSEGRRVVRMAVDCNGKGEISVYDVATTDKVPSAIFQEVPVQLFGAPFGENAVKYLVFEAVPGIGVANFAPDSKKSESNISALVTGTAMTSRTKEMSAKSTVDNTPIHELFHTLGAVQNGGETPPPPFASGAAHCIDGLDIMCYNDQKPSLYSTTRCPASEGYDTILTKPIDCGEDTYFDAAPEPNSWLDEYWNVAGPEDPFLVAPPSGVKTESASAVGWNSATLHGIFNPEGYGVSYRFEYGPTEEYGSSAPASGKTIDFGPNPIQVEESIEELLPDTTYHYRLVAESDAGAVYGEDETFTTDPDARFSSSFGSEGSGPGELSGPSAVALDSNGDIWVADAGNDRVQKFNTKGEYLEQLGSEGSGNGQLSEPSGLALDSNNLWVADSGNDRVQKWMPPRPQQPGVSTEKATSIGIDEATLHASITPNDADTEYHFEYGIDTSYGTSVPIPDEAIGDGRASVEVSQTIGNLAIDTTYHSRVIASNAVGTVESEDQTFATAPRPCGEKCEWSLQEAPQPKPQSQYTLDDVSCSSATKCTAIGFDNYQNSSFAEVWNGSEWTNTPWDPAAQMASISCAGSSCMTVPSEGEALSSSRLFDEGEESSPLEVPEGATAMGMRDVSCTSASACVAVGYYEENGEYKTLAETFDGSWSIQGTPGPGGGDGHEALRSVSCVSATYCMAVGEANAEPFAATWDGESWSAAEPEAIGGGLSSVSCYSTSSCMAVGAAAAGEALVEHWDGNSWSMLETASAEKKVQFLDEARLSGISCTSASTCSAVGTYTMLGGAEGQMLAARWGGTSWTFEGSSNLKGQNSTTPPAVSCTAANQCTAVGTSSQITWESQTETMPLAMRWNGSSWSLQATTHPEQPSASMLEAISCSSSAQCVAVGKEGYGPGNFAGYWNGNKWAIVGQEAIAPELGVGSAAVSCAPLSTCMAIGSSAGVSGTWVVHQFSEGSGYNEEFTEFASPPGAVSVNLRSLSCTSASACVAVGYYEENGEYKTLAETFDGSWSIQETPGGGDGHEALRSVSCVSATYCMAVGEANAEPFAASWDGEGWSATEPEASDGGLKSVSCRSASFCMAVGDTDEGEIVTERWDGESWSAVETDLESEVEGLAEARLSGVSCTAASSCSAVGSYLVGSEERTLALQWDGTGWSYQASPNPAAQPYSALSGIACTSEDRCIAVGTSSPDESKSETMPLVERYRTPTTTPSPPQAITRVATEVKGTSARVRAWVNPEGTPTSYYFEYGKSESYGSKTEVKSIVSGTTDVPVNQILTGLSGNTTYHYRVVAESAAGIAKSEDKAFTTPRLPQATTEAATGVKAFSATLHGTVNPEGSATSYYFQYGKSESYGSKVPLPKAVGSSPGNVAVSSTAIGLSQNTTYHYRVVAENANDLITGDDKTFKTLKPPAVKTDAASNVKAISATLNATVNPEGLATSYFFEYGETKAYGTKVPTISPKAIGSGASSVAASEPIAGLKAATTYHYRVVAENADGTANGADMTFITTEPTASQLAALPVTESFDGSSASLSRFSESWSTLGWASGATPKGSDTTTGWGSADSYSTINGTYYNPTVEDVGWGRAVVATMAANPGTKDHHFSLWLDSANPSSTTRSGYEVRFTNTAADTYKVMLSKWVKGTKTDITGISKLAAFPNGGSIALVDRGEVVGVWTDTGSGFTQKIAAGDSTFDGGNAGLQGAGTATRLNNVKISGLRIPEAKTEAATSVKATSATLNATVNPNSLATSYYFEYGKTEAYGSKTSSKSAGSGSSNVVVTETPTGLVEGTTYHYRVVAESEVGLLYGEDKTFTTLNPSNPPKATTEAATEVKASSATLNGTINPEGSETSYYFEYGESEAYGSKTSAKSAGSGTSSVAVNEALSGLKADATYHFRLVAKGVGVTVEGEDKEFTTSSASSPLSAITKPATEADPEGATLNATVNPASSPTGYIFEWGSEEEFEETSGYSNYTLERSIGSGTSDVKVSQEIEGLKPQTTYHFRVVAWNETGSAEGEDETFTTPAMPQTTLCKVSPTESKCAPESRYPVKTTISADLSKQLLLVIPGLKVECSSHLKAASESESGSPLALDIEELTFSNCSNNCEVKKSGEPVGFLSWTVGADGRIRYGAQENAPVIHVYCSTGYVNCNYYLPSLTLKGGNPAQLSAKETTLAEAGGALCPDEGEGKVTLKPATYTVTSPKPLYVAKAIAVPPKATTEAATDVKASSATLSGAVNPEGSETSYYFEYGETEAYGSKTSAKSAGSGTSNLAVSEPLSGLKSGVIYHYQVVATGASTVPGGDKTFTTLNPPKATTEAATDVKASSATLSGAVNPEGSETSYFFEYGESEAYGSKTSSKSAGSGTSSVAASESLSGLKVGTTYHYQVVAAGASTVPGGDKTFTTAADTRFDFAFGKAGSGNGELKSPDGIATDSTGNIWVVDSENNRVQKFNSKGGYLAKFGEKGSGNGQLNSPKGIGIDTEGNIWVVDSGNNRIEKFSPEGKWLLSSGSGEGKASSADGAFNSPTGIAVASSGNIFVVDTGNNRIEKFSSKGGYLAKFGEKGSGNGQLSSPTGIALSGSYVWVVDSANNRVQKFNNSSLKYVSQFGKEGSGNGEFKSPSGIALDAAGRLWVTDSANNRVQRFDEEGKYLDQFGEKGSGAGQLQSPLGIASPSAWGLLVVDSANNRVQRWTMVPDAPVAETEAASEVKSTSATLNATVNPNSLKTEYHFEYGKTTSYGTSIPIPDEAIDSGQGGVKVSKAIAGLASGTKYNFRVVATNSSGTTKGVNKTFTTP